MQNRIRNEFLIGYLRAHKTMYYMTMLAVSVGLFTFDEIGEKAAILDLFYFHYYNYVLM